MKWMVSGLLAGFLAIPYISFGGGENPSLGARSLGLAHASVTLKDEWALFNNLAGIAQLQGIYSMATYQNLYGIASINQLAFGVLLPYKKLGWGLSFYKFGDNYYNEIKAGLGCAHRIGSVSLGIKINYNQISIQEIGIKRNFLIEFGGIADISKHLSFGAHIYNLNQAKLIKEEKEYIPVIMKAGISYQPFDKLRINIETEKQVAFKAIFKAGIEYSIIRKINLRAGISLNPGINYFGAGFKDKRISVDYALNFHKTLGTSHQFSISYIFRYKDEK